MCICILTRLTKPQKSSRMNNNIIIRFGLFFGLTLSLVACDKKNDPKLPEPTQLLLPVNNENCSQGENVANSVSIVDFNWEESNHTDYYTLTITNLESSEEIIRDNLFTNQVDVYLPSGFPYQWYVTSNSDEFPDDSQSSDIWRFFLQRPNQTNSPPFPAQPISPKLGEAIELTDNNFLIQWEGIDADNDDLTYTLFIDSIDGLQPVAEGNKNLTAPNKEVSLASKTVYYWSVYSEDTFGNNSLSQTFSFRTK